MLIDDLQILVTADGSGVEQVLNKTIQIVLGTVNKINSQEIDWTSIFTASVSPALISGVASAFAYAIGSAVSFQAGMVTSGTAAGETASQIGQIGNAALALSTTVPASAQDLANTMLQLSAIFSSTNDQQQVAAEMAQLSASGFGNLNDIVTLAVDIFKQFGVTTTDQATTVLTDLMHAAEGAKESIPALGNQFSSFSSLLPGIDKNISTFNGLISAFAGEVRTIGSSGAEKIFSALGSAANGSNPALTALFGGLENIRNSLQINGGLTTIEQVSQKLKDMGPEAALVASGFGLSAQQVAQFQINAKDLPKLTQNVKDIATNSQSIGTAFRQSDSDLRTLIETWNTFKDVSIHVGAFVIDGIKGWGVAINDLFNTLDKLSAHISSNIKSTFTAPDFVAKGTSTSMSTDASLLNVVAGPGSPLVSALQNLTDALTQNVSSSHSSVSGNSFPFGIPSSNSSYNAYQGTH